MENPTIEIFTEEGQCKLDSFDCGKASLNIFLKEHLKRQHKAKILRGYILKTQGPEPRALGYYTLSGSCFEKSTLSSKTQQKKSLIKTFHALRSVGLHR